MTTVHFKIDTLRGDHFGRTGVLTNPQQWEDWHNSIEKVKYVVGSVLIGQGRKWNDYVLIPDGPMGDDGVWEVRDNNGRKTRIIDIGFVHASV